MSNGVVKAFVPASYKDGILLTETEPESKKETTDEEFLNLVSKLDEAQCDLLKEKIRKLLELQENQK